MKYANVMVGVIWPGVALTYLRFIDLTSHALWQGGTKRIALKRWKIKSSGSGESMEADNYSAPFELALPGDTVCIWFPARINDNRK